MEVEGVWFEAKGCRWRGCILGLRDVGEVERAVYAEGVDIFDIIDSCSSNSIDKNIVLTEAGVVEKLASRKDPVY